jgi:hypothetical protein
MFMTTMVVYLTQQGKIVIVMPGMRCPLHCHSGARREAFAWNLSPGIPSTPK